MTLSRFLQRLVGGDDASAGGAASLRNVAVWLFIALVALFLTQPSGGPFSARGMQVPWPAELGLDGNSYVSPDWSGSVEPLHRQAGAGAWLRAGRAGGHTPPRCMRHALARSALLRIVASVAFGVIRLPS